MGLAAAKELAKLVAQEDGEQKWARAQSQMNKIIECWRVLPAEYQQMLMAKLEDKPWPPVEGANVIPIDRGRVSGDDEYEPLRDKGDVADDPDDDEDYYDDDDA